jgi:hypothetical protein
MQVNSCDFTVAYSLPPLAHAALVQSPLLRCEVCKKSFKSSETLSAHYESVKHKKREAELQKLSPAKRSPAKRNNTLAALEQQASSMQGPRAAQAYFDVGVQHAQQGDGASAKRCLVKCLSLLPVIAGLVSVSRVMIEVRCRVILARVAWLSDVRGAMAELDQALSLMHSSNASPFALSKDGCVVSVSHLTEACEHWLRSLRHAELEPHFVALSREWGARITGQLCSFSAAGLLMCGRHYDYAAIVFEGLKLFGHASECLFRQNDIGACVQSCILHSNFVLLRKCASSSNHPVLKQLAEAYSRWDLASLDHLSCAPNLLDSERELVKLAIAVLSKA